MHKRLLPWMAGGLIALFPLLSRAFGPDEQLFQVRLLASHPGNIVVLNRGMEDGIAVGAHARLKTGGGYAARALCVKVGMLTSHWRVYRVVDADLVSKDLTYTLQGAEFSEPPEDIGKLKDVDHSKKVPDYDEKKLLPPVKTAAVKNDLPEDLTKDPYAKEASKGSTQIFVEKTFDRQRLERDFRSYKGSIYASPWSTQKGPTDVQTLRFGARLANEGSKYRMALGFDRSTLKAAEKRSGEEVRNETTEAGATFTIKDLTPSWDAYSDLTWRQARYGEDWAPQHHVLFAPIGFTWKAQPDKTWKQAEVSWAPTYDTRHHRGGLRPDGKETDGTDDGLRHAFRLLLRAEVTPDFALTSDLRWRPRQETSGKLDLSDNLAQERFTASLRVVGSLHVDYELQWLDDAQLWRLSRLSRVVTTNSLNVRWDFGL